MRRTFALAILLTASACDVWGQAQPAPAPAQPASEKKAIPLGDLVRSERERKRNSSKAVKVLNEETLPPQPANTARPAKGGPAAASEVQALESGAVEIQNRAAGVRLVVPKGCGAGEAAGLAGRDLEVACELPGDARLTLRVDSRRVADTKSAITDADRRQWDWEVWRDSGRYRQMGSGDVTVGAYPAYQSVYEEMQGAKRYRVVRVLAADVHRVFTLAFTLETPGEARLNEHNAALDEIVQSFSPLTDLAAAEELGWLDQFLPQEKVALIVVRDITVWQHQECRRRLNRFCSTEELFADIEAQTGKPIPREEDPRRDPNYVYSVQVRADALEVSAVPRRPGLGGFFGDARGIHYHQGGPASAASAVVLSPSRIAASRR